MGNKIKKPKLAVLGTTLIVFAIIALLYSIFATFSFLILLVYYFTIVMAVIFTVFTILANEGFKEFTDKGEAFTQFCMTIQQTAPYALGVVMLLSLCSFFSYMGTKNYHGKNGGMIVAGIVFGIALIVLILNLVGVGRIVQA